MIDWDKCPAVESIPGKHIGDWLFTGTLVPIFALFGNLAEGAPSMNSWTGSQESRNGRSGQPWNTSQDLDKRTKHENSA